MDVTVFSVDRFPPFAFNHIALWSENMSCVYVFWNVLNFWLMVDSVYNF